MALAGWAIVVRILQLEHYEAAGKMPSIRVYVLVVSLLS